MPEICYDDFAEEKIARSNDMARPCKKRRICGKPICNCFTPREAGSYESVVMNLDEYECIRLIDYEGLEQEQCSEQMGVSRATIQAIYKSAREKMADAVINAKELHIEGGNIAFCEKMSFCKRQHCFAEKEKIYMERKGGIEMRIAVTYENGEVFGHFGHTEQFKLYDVKEGKIQSEAIFDSNGRGHGALATLLAENEVDVLICGGIGGGAQMALKDAGIKLYGGVSGSADAAVRAFLDHNLDFNPDVKCDHHGEGHEHQENCGSGGSGSHSCHN